MITLENIAIAYPQLDQAILPKALKQPEYQFLVENLDLYQKDEDIKAFIDTFVEKLNNQLQPQANENSATEVVQSKQVKNDFNMIVMVKFSDNKNFKAMDIQKGVQVNNLMHATLIKRSKLDELVKQLEEIPLTEENITFKIVKAGTNQVIRIIERKAMVVKETKDKNKKNTHKKQKAKYKIGQNLYWFDNDGKTLIKENIRDISYTSDGNPLYSVTGNGRGNDWQYQQQEITKALKQGTMFLTRPATPVAKLAPDVAFIKRYITMNGKTKTKPQIVAFIKSLQKAIVEQVIRKSSEHSEMIMNIQDELLKCYKLMGNQILITIETEKYAKYKAILDGLEVHPAVKLIKRFIALFGVQDEKIKAQRAERLLTALEKQMEQLQNDPTYGKAIADMYETLEHYLDKESDLTISEQQLNGLMGLAGITDLGQIPPFLVATTSNLLANVIGNAINGKAKQPALSGTGETIMRSTDIVKMEFQTLNFDGKFKELIGNPSVNFSAMVYGMPGGGKTTFCILFANYLASELHKKVLFATIEEGINHTFKDKLNRLEADHPQLIVADYLPQNLTPYDVIVIDSVNTFQLSPEALRNLRKQYPGKIFIHILQCTKDGKFKGSQEYEHDVDVVICVENGIASTIGHKNRFGKCGEMEVW